MTRILAVLLSLATPVSALSCLPPDARQLYVQAAESDEFFAIVIGRIDPEDPIEIPAVPQNGSSPKTQEATTRVRMSGLALNAEEFATAFDRDIDVKVTCLSIWCGNPVTDRDILAALRLTDGVPELEIGPCGGNAMPLDQADLDALLRCHRSGICGGE